MEDLPGNSLRMTVDHKTLKILPRGVNLSRRNAASMIVLESAEWFDLQHNFLILDKAKALPIRIACVAGAKRGGGGGGGREKGKREGSACSKSLCFCITPTNFLVIRLRLLSIKCRYTRHCRKTLYSRTKEIRLVIQIQKTLWRKLEPLFCRNKKSFTLQKRSKKLRLHQKANPADQKTITTVNRYVCHGLSV